MRYFKFKALLQKDSWLSPAFIGVGSNGNVEYIADTPPDEATAIEIVNGYALPGLMNAHSHAFQYGMAGLAEQHPKSTHDDFWTWREAMYQCALSVNPEQVEAIAAMVYAEMIRHGYTHVAEFHYLHHDTDGKPYTQLSLMGEHLLRAAKIAGINITLIPVFYQRGGFGRDPEPRQRRFISQTVDSYFHLLEETTSITKKYEGANTGFSVHSLRAVNLPDIITCFQQGPHNLPFHLHIAEQKREIDDCLAWCNKRPAEWLLENLPVDHRFNLIHATHLDHKEVQGLAASAATVVLCPSTEGNLGDGIFRMKEFCSAGGHWTIGTDSHIGINPLEEFRMIDYHQRLVTHQRNTFPDNGAHYLLNESVSRGRMAMGNQLTDHFSIDQSFDAFVVDAASPLLENTSPSNLLSTIVYAADAAHSIGTIIMGEWITRNGVHRHYEAIRNAFGKVIKAVGNR